MRRRWDLVDDGVECMELQLPAAAHPTGHLQCHVWWDLPRVTLHPGDGQYRGLCARALGGLEWHVWGGGATALGVVLPELRRNGAQRGRGPVCVIVCVIVCDVCVIVCDGV